MKFGRWTHALFLVALLLLNIAVKYSLWIQPSQTFPDSVSYTAPAMRLLDGLGYGSQENGFRTPTYPLFIAAILLPFDHHDLSSCRGGRDPACLGEAQHEPSAQMNLRAIVLIQIILGLLVIPMVYAFAWKVSRNAWVATLCALTYPLDLSTGYWEISILSETLTTFLLSLAMGLMLLADAMPRFRFWILVALGGILGVMALCYFALMLYAIIPAVFLSLRIRPRGYLAPVLLIPALFVFGWSARNYLVDGYFTPSTVTGINLTQMVGSFMEEAPPEDRDLAEIYLRYRAQRIAERGSHAGTIYIAYREMLDERNTTWVDLSKALVSMSWQMILRNPRGYLQTVWQSFTQFWKFGLGKQNPLLPMSFEWVKWFFDDRVQQAATILFFLSPGVLALLQWQKQVELYDAFWIGLAIATVFFVAIFSSTLAFGDNERYRAPVARLQYSAIILTAGYAIESLRAKRSNLQIIARGLLRRKERSSQ